MSKYNQLQQRASYVISINLLVVILFLSAFIPAIHSNDEQLDGENYEELSNLDPNLKQMALNLLSESANKTFLSELLNSDDYSFVEINSFPDEAISAVYMNCTWDQISALETELQLHEHFIYDPIKEKTKQIKMDFVRSCDDYKESGDIFRLEKDFLSTGDQIVSLQKLIIRIINSKLEEKIRTGTFPRQYSIETRNVIMDTFDYLSRLFFGISTSYYKSSSFTPVNQLWTLIQLLDDTIKQQSSNNELHYQSVSELRTLINRLRYIYYLYRIASYSNQMLNTIHLKPLAYQATIKLVDLLGYHQFSNPIINPLLSQFKFWMNLLSGNIQLNIFSQPSAKPSKYDPQQVSQLIRILKENEKRRREQIEQNRLNSMLKELLNNQNKQQEQIDAILRILANKTNTNTNSNRLNEQGSTTTALPGITQNVMPAITNGPIRGGDTLNQLKQQRKLLNELLQELQKPFNQSSNVAISNNKNNGNYNQIPVSPRPNHNNNIAGPGQNRNQTSQQQELTRAQNALMSIMRNITPLINVISQTNLVPRPTIYKSKLDLMTILNSMITNNNNQIIQLNSGTNDVTFMEQMANRLKKVLDEIIHHVSITFY